MSTEAYVPPTLVPQPALGGTQTNAPDTSRPVRYICGDCNAKVILRRHDVVRCGECGHRVLYKERTNRMVQFEAR